MCTTAETCIKALEPVNFDGLKSFNVIDVETSKKRVTGACYDKQPVCAYTTVFTLVELMAVKWPLLGSTLPVSYTHLTLPTNREV